jgi:hypothetical protein
MAKKRYRVVGELPVSGAQPGEEFQAEFLEHEEEALLASGAIEVVSDKAKEK